MEALMAELMALRGKMVQHLAQQDPGLGLQDIQAAVQRLLDRWLYRRLCAARGIIIDEPLEAPAPAVSIDEEALARVENSPHLLGKLYEQFLGQAVEAQKAGGAYYTPDYIVAHIVGSALAKLLTDKTPEQVSQNPIRIIDPACGSGVFLLVAYQYLLQWYGAKTLAERKRILLRHIYGVDKDPQAVDVTRRSLLLIALEGGGKERIDLAPNIKCGDSLDEGSFNWKEEFPAVMVCGGFDAVLGNPPYVSFGLRDAASLGATEKAYYRRRFAHAAEYKISTYALFMQLGVELLRETGVCGYIVPDSFLLGRYFSKLRKYLLDTCGIDSLLMVQAKVFDRVIVGLPVIFQVTRTGAAAARENHQVTTICCDRADQFQQQAKSWSSLTYSQAYFLQMPFYRFRLFFDKQAKALVEQVEAALGQPLSTFVKLSSGLIGKASKESITSLIPHGPDWRPGLLSGKEVVRYGIFHQGGYIHYNIAKLKSGFRDAHYDQPKLLCRQTGDRLTWAYDDQTLLCLNNLHVGNLRSGPYHPFYLLGILNSRLLNAYYQLITLEAGRSMAQTDIETLSGLPIRALDMADPEERALHDQLVQIVGQIIADTAQRKSTQTLERQVDEMLYRLYELTDEIKMEAIKWTPYKRS